MILQNRNSRSIDESLKRMEQLVSPLVGITNKISQLPLENGDPLVYIFGAEMADVHRLGFLSNSKNSGGAGLTYDEGKISALGEMVERYSASIYNKEELIFGSYKELSKSHLLLHPERFALFSEKQYGEKSFPFQQFIVDTKVSWVKGFSLVQQKEVLVPASRVFLPYMMSCSKEANIGPGLSTGLAAGATLEMAILSGLYECFERDAFTIFWMNDLPAKKVNIKGASHSLELKKIFNKHFNAPGYEYRVFEITNDLDVCTIYVILTSSSKIGDVHIVGAASHLDGQQAVLKALIEAVQGKPYVMHEIKKDPGWKVAPNFENINDFAQSCKVYTVTEKIQPHLFSVENRIISSIYPNELPTLKSYNTISQINELVRRLEIKGYEAVVVDITPLDIKSLGMNVVRVIIPELQQLHGIHRYPFLGGKRLYDVPFITGYKNEIITEENLSPYPHPFP